MVEVHVRLICLGLLSYVFYGITSCSDDKAILLCFTLALCLFLYRGTVVRSVSGTSTAAHLAKPGGENALHNGAPIVDAVVNLVQLSIRGRTGCC